MRFDLKKSFGYPVLRENSEDYLDSTIKTSFTLTQVPESNSEFFLDYDVVIGVDEIIESINSRDLILIISCFCPKTLHSISINSFDLNGRSLIDMRDFRGDIRIETEIVVNSNEYLLNSKKFHQEYGVNTFTLTRGQVVAQAWPEKVFVEREIFTSISSLFQWSTNDELEDGLWKMVVTPSKIKIQINQKQRNLLINSSNSKEGRAVLLNSIFFPALIQLINYAIAGDYDENDVWFRVIEVKLSSMNKVIGPNSDPIELAQSLLKKPLSNLNQTIFKED
jgi:hypothetical protein